MNIFIKISDFVAKREKNKEYKRYDNEDSLVQLVNIFIKISDFIAKREEK